MFSDSKFEEKIKIQINPDFQEMYTGFLDDMKGLTKPDHNRNFWNNLQDLFVRAYKVDDKVIKFCKEKLEKIFVYTVEHKLKPNNISWNVFGFCMWSILYHPGDTEILDLPQEIVDYVLEQFDGRRITLEKINGIYTVVFAKNS